MELRSTYHIYMPRSRRMSIAGCKFVSENNIYMANFYATVTKNNVATVVKAIDAVVRTSGKN